MASNERKAAAMKARASSIFWLLLGIILCLHIFIRLVTQSMTIDGTLYAAISRNLANGQGSLWHLHYSNSLFPYFVEHPPLMMWLQAVGFLLFGDSIVVEKSFSFVCLLLNGAIILLIWRQLSRGTRYQGLGVCVLIFTAVAGKIGFAFGNGLIENLQMLFTSLAVLFILAAYQSDVNASRILKIFWMVGAGLAIVLALLSKGPVGLFPLAVPAFYAAVFGSPRIISAAFDTSVMLVTVLAIFFVTLLFDGPREYILQYANGQLVASLSGARGGRGFTIGLLVFLPTLLYISLIAGLLWLFSVWLGPVSSADKLSRGTLKQTGIFLFAIGFAASAPIFASPRVAAYYFNPSMPFFAMSFLCFCAPHIINITERLSAAWLRRATMALTAIFVVSFVFVAMNVGKPGQDRDLIEDARLLATHICPSSQKCEKSVATCRSVYEDWQFHVYVGRNHRVDLVPKAPAADDPFFLTDDMCAMPAERRASEILVGLSRHHLYGRDPE